MKALTIVAILLLSAITGCKQNPFPTNGEIQNEKQKKPDPILPPLVIDLPETIEFHEGELNEVAIKATVPAPGTPILIVDDLPQGAAFDPAALKLSWTPDFSAGDEPNDPTSRFRTHVVIFTLRSSAEPTEKVSRRALIIVRNVPRPVDIILPPEGREALEGKEFVETVSVATEDYPNGPFHLNPTNLPSSAILEQVPGTKNQWRIKYTPDLRAVTVKDSDSNGYYKNIDVKYTVVLPNGHSVSKVSKWKLVDARRMAVVSAPKNVVQGGDVSFTIVAEDVNGEGFEVAKSAHPTVSVAKNVDEGVVLLPTGVPFGTFTTATAQNDVSRGGVNPVTIATFRWNQIPVEKMGTSYTLRFRVCVNRTSYYKDLCSFPEVTVKFDAEAKPAPLIDRSKWPMAQLRYVRQNEPFSIPLRVTDGEVGGPSPKVLIFPVSMREEVKWDSHKLTITPKTVGNRQFNVVATSPFGVAQAESFLYETLPWSWSKVLILAESQNDPEARKTLDLFDDAALANPAMQAIDERLLALRTTLVVGTKTLSDRGVIIEVEKAAANIPNVILLTPLLATLEGTLKTELENLKITIDKRFLDLGGLPPLKTFEIGLGLASTLTSPSNVIRLSEKLTTESNSPMTLRLETASKCQGRLYLKQATVADPLLAVATCKRANGGALVVSGFEWGDLETSLPDAKIAKKWMSEVGKP